MKWSSPKVSTRSEGVQCLRDYNRRPPLVREVRWHEFQVRGDQSVVASDASAWIGVDIGTTGTRAVVFDRHGRVLEAISRTYPLLAPRPGWAAQSPTTVHDATTAALTAAASWARTHGWHVRAVGLSAILHSVLPADASGNALDDALIWADTRGDDEARAIRGTHDPLALYRRTGGPVHPMYLPAKIRWWRAHRHEIFAAAAQFVGIKDYVVGRWTGTVVTDRSTASGTGFFDAHTFDWADDLLDIAGIGRRHMPPLVEPIEAVDVSTAWLRSVGLPDDCLLVAGAGDGVLQTLGTGVSSPGQFVAMVATSGAVRSVVDHQVTDGDLARTWCYYLAEGRWVAGAAINNAGIVLAWLRDHMAAVSLATGGREPTLDEITGWASEVSAGAGGLIFLPYLAGERAPGWNARARGTIVGLSLSHNHRHIARATLEGVAYRMRTILEPMEEVAGAAQEIRVAGGFIRSPLWMQATADVLGRNLTLVDSPEASSLGAAILAMRATGDISSLDKAPYVAPIGNVSPDAKAGHIYDALYTQYRAIYTAMTPHWDAISAWQAAQADTS
jgi:gluconokinase